MLRTPVPEAAVDEDRYSCAGEHYIGRTAKRRLWSVIDSVPKPGRVQRVPNGKFWFGVAAAIGPHRTANAAR